MYEFVDKGGRHVALRPEQTASVCRAFVAAPADDAVEGRGTPGPNFRYEKPQRGRYRQFDQVGIEVLGADDPYLDVEVIALGWRVLRGASACARSRCCSTRSASPTTGPATSRRCARTSRPTVDALTAESRATLDRNPLRVLDSKRAPDAAVIAAAPHDRRLLQRRGGRPLRRRAARASTPSASRSRVEPRLVRGLDYYLRTTFEFPAARSTRRQNALGGGGRYDGLVEALGGPPTPGVGFALGARPHAAGLRRRGRVRRRRTSRSTCSSSTRPAAREALAASPTSCAGRARAPTAPTTTAA